MVRRIAALVLAAGCSIPEKHAAPDLVCRDELLPAMADPTVSLSGVVVDASGAGVESVMLRPRYGSQTLNATVTDAEGAFFYTHDTGGVPRVEQVDVTHPDYLALRFYPAVPVWRTIEGLELHLMSAADATNLASAAGVTLDPAKGVIVVRVVDCNSSPLVGGTVSTSPRSPDVRYFVDGAPSASATTTDDSGLAMIANVNAASVTVTGSYEGTSMRSHDVAVIANGVIETALQP